MTEHGGILVVDDTPLSLKLLTDILVMEGYRVRPANNGELALASIKVSPPELVLLDIRMPGMDGFEVCRRLKADPTSKDIPVIFISASTALEDRVEGFALGAVDFISKPFQREELLARVRTHLELDRLKTQLEARIEERTMELKEERDLVENILETASAIILALDTEGRIERINPYMESVSGYRFEEVRGRDWVATFLPDGDRDHIRQLFVKVMGGSQILTNVNSIITKDGEKRQIEWYVNSLKDAEGRVTGILSVGQDITMRSQAEEDRERLIENLRVLNQALVLSGVKIQEQAEIAQRRASELETIIWSITDAIFICDKVGYLIDVNEAGLQLIGLKERPENSPNLFDLLGLLKLRCPDGKPISDHRELALWRALHGETVRELEEIAQDRCIPRDIHLLVSAVPIRDKEENITGAVEVMIDITRLRELDMLKDQFVAVAAHELKTPVTIMKGYSQLLLQTSDDLPPAHRSTLEAVNRGADRIDKIVRDLLDISLLFMSRLEVSLEKLDLAELLKQVVDRMSLPMTKHNIRLFGAEPAVIQGDCDRLTQVLVNLLDNAIRYSPYGGDVDVAVTLKEFTVEVSVKDLGIGIPKEKQEHIFQRFYRAHTNTPYDYGGMGVGLYISSEIINRHGGHMWFESQDGKGSTFHFSLPLQAAIS